MSKYIPGNQKHLTLEDLKYKECLSQSRAGINITRHELHQEDMVITPLIFQGQSPYQIITNHPELDMSVRTLYSYLDKGILSARNIDLKRQVKFNPRKVHKTQITPDIDGLFSPKSGKIRKNKIVFYKTVTKNTL